MMVEQVADKKLTTTCLTAVDVTTGLGFCVVVPKNGNCNYSILELQRFLCEIGRSHCQVQADNEPSILALTDRLIKTMPGLSRKGAARYSPQTLGNVERMNGLMQTQALTLLIDLRTRYKLTELEMNVTSPMFTWMLKRVAFLNGRFLLRDDGQTSFERRWQKPYSSALCLLGETVLARKTEPIANSTTNWTKAIWLGRCTVSNEIIVGFPDGTVKKVRTIRRLVVSEQCNKELLLSITAVPWTPQTDGTLDADFIVKQSLIMQLKHSELQESAPPAV
jgi:hypothetical protein